ncbi:MAG: B12-binding domain-containing radical SAM protein [Phycisphaeraceae bacterium]|nr:MAG: B12-binding domain-containing radical SAM protein [Phycisphaeraceae bacterium]
MNIALVAMSGIRVCDEDLLRLGLTLPGFVERSKAIASLPSLGLLTLAGATPDTHHVDYIEVDQIDGADPTLASYDLVAISTFTAQALEAYALADRIRQAGGRVVIGGPHVTVLPDEASQHADAVVLGDGEAAWPDLLADAEAGCLEPRYGDARGRFDLAESPMPAFELLDIDRYNRLTVQTSRGCPFRCEFCAGSILFSPKYRQKPVERVLAEIDRIRDLWRRPFIEFADDNGLVNRAYWRRLLPELAGRRIKWFTETDVSIADDPEFLDLLASSGCAEVLVGLESPIEAGLPGLERRADWKHKRWETNLDAVQCIQAHGIRVNGCFIVGLDGQTPAVFDDIHDFALEAGLFDVQITLPTPFPGTPFYHRLKAAGRLTHDGQWGRCTLFDLNFVPTPMSSEELVAGFHDLARRLYSDEYTAMRRGRFAEAARRRRPAAALEGGR